MEELKKSLEQKYKSFEQQFQQQSYAMLDLQQQIAPVHQIPQIIQILADVQKQLQLLTEKQQQPQAPRENSAEFERRLTSDSGNLSRNLKCDLKLEFPKFEISTTSAPEMFDESPKKGKLEVVIESELKDKIGEKIDKSVCEVVGEVYEVHDIGLEVVLDAVSHLVGTGEEIIDGYEVAVEEKVNIEIVASEPYVWKTLAGGTKIGILPVIAHRKAYQSNSDTLLEITKFNSSHDWGGVGQAASELITTNIEPILEQYRPMIVSSMKFCKLTLGIVVHQSTGVSIIEYGCDGGIKASRDWVMESMNKGTNSYVVTAGFGTTFHRRNGNCSHDHANEKGLTCFAIDFLIASASSLLFVYSWDYARTRPVNGAQAAKKGGERQFNGLVDVYKKTLKSDGVAGLCRGFDISCVGIIVFHGLYFGMYDSLKPVLIIGKLQDSSFASFALGWVITNGAGLASYSIDTVSRRMMMTSGEAFGKWKGPLTQCVDSVGVPLHEWAVKSSLNRESSARQAAIAWALERKPNAFRRMAGQHITLNTEDDAKRLTEGCHCKKSGCFKNYCSCFRAYSLCSEQCTCMNCKNLEGNQERLAFGSGMMASKLTKLDPENLVIAGSVGQSGYQDFANKNDQNLQSLNTEDPSPIELEQTHQLVNPRSGDQLLAPTTEGFSKLAYRSLLAGLIQPQAVKELSVLLIVVSEANNDFKEKHYSTNLQAEGENHMLIIDSPANQDVEQSHGLVDQNAKTKYDLQDALVATSALDPRSCDNDQHNERPVSPGTLKLTLTHTLIVSCNIGENDLSVNSSFDADFDSFGNSKARIVEPKFRMTIAELLDESKVVPVLVYGNLEIEITGIQHDSRMVASGALFVCCVGKKTDGHMYLSEADKRRAVAVVASKEIDIEDTLGCKALIIVEDTSAVIAALSASFYRYPSKKMSVIGITGTNGKTSTSYLIKGMYEIMGVRTGMLEALPGTLELKGDKEAALLNATYLQADGKFLFRVEGKLYGLQS